MPRVKNTKLTEPMLTSTVGKVAERVNNLDKQVGASIVTINERLDMLSNTDSQLALAIKTLHDTTQEAITLLTQRDGYLQKQINIAATIIETTLIAIFVAVVIGMKAWINLFR